MKIKFIEKKEQTVEKEITLPYYCKKTDFIGTTYYGVVSEERLVKVFNETFTRQVTESATEAHKIEIANADEIDKSEFYAVFYEVLTYIKTQAESVNVLEPA
jgi:hypothetical protein